MAVKQYLVQTNFTAGEFSPLMDGRVDLAKYENGLSLCENFIPSTNGPLLKRTGTKYIAAAKRNSGNMRLIPYEYSTEENYIIEMGSGYFRFFTNQGQVMTGGVPYEVANPYTEDQIADVKFALQEGVMYFVHQNHAPHKLISNGVTNWSFAVVYPDGPYDVEGPSSVTLQWSGGTGRAGTSSTITASANLFESQDVGRSMMVFAGNRDTASERIEDQRYHSFYITGYTDAQNVTATWIRGATNDVSNWASATAEDDWFMGVLGYDPSVARTYFDDELRSLGWPGLVSFFENRLIYAAPEFAIQTLYGSALGVGVGTAGRSRFDSFMKFVTNEEQPDDMAYSYTLVADSLNKIQWVVSSKVLAIGTSGGEWRLGQLDSTAPITPTSVFAKRETTHGTCPIPGVLLGNLVVFLQKNRKKLRAWRYRVEDGAFRAEDLTLLAEHVLADGAVDMAKADDPEQRIYCVTSDGDISVLTFLLEQEVVGWSRTTTNGSFKAIAAIPTLTDEDGRTEVWVIVERNTSNGMRYYVELFTGEQVEDPTEWDFVDSSLVYSGAVVTSISGLDHLEGMEVAIWGDGAVQNPKTVTGGTITLDTPVSSAVIGLAYTAKAKTLKLEPGTADAPGQAAGLGLMRRIDRVNMRFYETLNAKCGPDEDDLLVVPFRSTFDATGEALPLFTGDKKFNFPKGMGEDPRALVVSDTNTPMTLIALGVQMQTSER